MKKIPTLFVRDPENRKTVLDEITPGCEWVINGEGKATRKFDGTCVMIRDGKLYKRHEIKAGKATPPEFELADHDENTGKSQGWLPVGDGAEDQYHREAFALGREPGTGGPLPNGTYELVGPKIQGNPEGWRMHYLVNHETATSFPEFCGEPPRTIEGIRAWLLCHAFEGIVWHHPDGRMAKIKKRDFQN